MDSTAPLLPGGSSEVIEPVVLENGDLVIVPKFPSNSDGAEGATPASPLTVPTMLIVEDDDVDAEVLVRLIDRLYNQTWKVVRAKSLAGAQEILRVESPRVALVDLNLADAWHSDVVRTIVDGAPGCAIIVQTGSENEKIPTEMLELGAQDFLQKGAITADSLGRSIRYALARHQTLEALRHTTSQLAKANAELDEFAHVVAHDLRGPTRTARMLAARMIQDIPEDSGELAHELGARLDDVLGYMDGMILSMLDYAGLQRITTRLRPVAAAAVVADAVGQLEADLTQAGGAVSCTVPDNIEVLADNDLLHRVIHNIIGNSIKYRELHRPLHIEISAKRVDGPGNEVELRFADNGIGVPVADHELVFGLLERLHHNKADGLGFGLAICRKIVEAFEGTIWIEPTTPQREPAQGCTLVIRLTGQSVGNDDIPRIDLSE